MQVDGTLCESPYFHSLLSRQGQVDLRECWAEVARHWSDRLPVLARAVPGSAGQHQKNTHASSRVLPLEGRRALEQLCGQQRG